MRFPVGSRGLQLCQRRRGAGGGGACLGVVQASECASGGAGQASERALPRCASATPFRGPPCPAGPALSSLISLPDEGEPPKGKGVVDECLVVQERGDGVGILSRDDNGNGHRLGGTCIGFVALVFMRSPSLRPTWRVHSCRCPQARQALHRASHRCAPPLRARRQTAWLRA